MNVLVTFASKYGATEEIAHVIGSHIAEAGHVVTVTPCPDVRNLDQYDAVVVGSAVYSGWWLRPARDFLVNNADELRMRPVWLFSSGPLGDPPTTDDPTDADGMIKVTRARNHQVFGGRLVRAKLRFADKAIAAALRAPEGDFRDWGLVRKWTSSITETLSGSELYRW